MSSYIEWTHNFLGTLSIFLCLPFQDLLFFCTAIFGTIWRWKITFERVGRLQATDELFAIQVKYTTPGPQKILFLIRNWSHERGPLLFSSGAFGPFLLSLSTFGAWCELAFNTNGTLPHPNSLHHLER